MDFVWGGRPAWGKNFNENLDFYKLYGDNLVKFNEIRKQLDPEDLFMNEFMEKVLRTHPDIPTSKRKVQP